MNQDQIPIDWFLTRSIATENGFEVDRAQSVSPLRRFLTPICDSYFTGFKQIFLGECTDLWSLGASDIWMVRDGLVPLLWFFERFPEPKEVKCRLYVEERLAPHIAAPWRPYFGTYKFGRLPVEGKPARRTKKTKLLVTGILSRSYCSVEYVRKLLDQASQDFREEFSVAKPEATLCLLQRTDPLVNAQDMTLHSLQTLVSVSQEFAGKLSAMSLSEFYDRIDFSEFAVIDLNEGFLCADSWMLHRAVQRGASLLGKPLAAGYSKYVNLDLVHGFALNRRVRGTKGTGAKVTEEAERALASSANHGFPWKVWGDSVRQYSIHYSVASRLPVRLSDLDKDYSLLHSNLNGGVDSVEIEGNAIVVEGWCYDSASLSPYANLHLGYGDETLQLRADRLTRTDLGSLEKTFPNVSSAGFAAKIPLEHLPADGGRDGLLWVFASFEDERAQVVGAVKVWDGERLYPTVFSVADKFPYPSVSIEGNFLQITEDAGDLAGPRQTFKYIFQKITSSAWNELWGYLDVCRIEGNEVSLEGWAADTREMRVAEAVFVFYEGKCVARIHPSLFRPDIARLYDKKLLLCGFKFDFKAPSEIDCAELRLFVVWEDGVGIEISLASLNQ